MLRCRTTCSLFGCCLWVWARSACKYLFFSRVHAHGEHGAQRGRGVYNGVGTAVSMNVHTLKFQFQPLLSLVVADAG